MSEIITLKGVIKRNMECLEKAKRKHKALLNRKNATSQEIEDAQLQVAFYTRILARSQSKMMALVGIKKT